MKKVLNLDLDYGLPEPPEPKEGEVQPKRLDNPEITRNIIDNAFVLNHPNMDSKISVPWRRIVLTMQAALKGKKVFVVFSEQDFEILYTEVKSANFKHQQAFIVPVTIEELDIVKNRSDKESKEILASIEQADKASEQVSKVLEMSKGKTS